MAGLTSADAAHRRREYGPNALPAATPPSLIQSTRRAQMAPNRDSRVATGVQPLCKAIQDRAEQS